jgi:hypothetical protein
MAGWHDRVAKFKLKDDKTLIECVIDLQSTVTS